MQLRRGCCGSGGFQQAYEDKDPVIDSTLSVLPVPGCPRVRERGGTQCDRKGKGLPPRPKRNHEQDT